MTELRDHPSEKEYPRSQMVSPEVSRHQRGFNHEMTDQKPPQPYRADSGPQRMYPDMSQPPLVEQSMPHNTTVVIAGQQPVVQQPMRSWSTGLCGCCEDPMTCVCVMFCPECYACHLASKAGETCCLPCCVPGWMISLRAHIRGKHNIMGSICDDCCKVACCYPCAMCQLSREIDNINTGMAPP